jgi:gluconolactonase
MLRCALLIPLLVGWMPLRAEEPPPPEANSIVPKGAKLELLWTRGDGVKGGLTEGPAAAPDGSIYFSDIRLGKDKSKIMRFDPKTKKTTVFAKDSHHANGLMFDARGYLVACEGADMGGRCVSRYNVKTGKRVILAKDYMGKHFNAPNDLCIDLKDRIYFTDPRYLGDEPRELKYRAVYRVGKDGGTVIEITHDVEKPNGIAISPDQKTLYIADHNNGTDKIDPKAPPPKHGAMKLYAFPLGPDGKVSGKRKTLIDFGSEAGIDGMTVDMKGNLYMAVRSLKRPGILVADPQGKELAYIPTGKPQPGAKNPVGLPSNCDFGIGEESKVLYVTVDVSLYRIPLKIDGYHVLAPK